MSLRATVSGKVEDEDEDAINPTMEQVDEVFIRSQPIKRAMHNGYAAQSSTRNYGSAAVRCSFVTGYCMYHSICDSEKGHGIKCKAS